jgi:hypothetical protein
MAAFGLAAFAKTRIGALWLEGRLFTKFVIRLAPLIDAHHALESPAASVPGLAATPWSASCL